MNRPAALREPMDMPNPHFPVKLHLCSSTEEGRLLFASHWHEHLELLYFISGEAVIECNGVPHSVSAGDIIVLNSNDLHQGFSRSGRLVYYALIADLALLQSQSPDAVETQFITPITRNRIVFRNKITAAPGLAACLDAIIDEFKGKELGYELSVKSYMYRLLTLLLRGFLGDCQAVAEVENRRRHLQRFAPILQYIEENYLQELTAEELARMAGLSRSHFSRLFGELTNGSVADYVNRIKINKSEYLLQNTEMTISEIALAAGYHDISYFSRTFKKYRSMPPSRLRSASASELMQIKPL